MDASKIIVGQSVVPVVVINDPNKALKLAEILLSTGFNCIEITLRTENALNCIKSIASEFPTAKIGAGSVITPAQLRATEDAGSHFAVSPGASDELLDAAKASHLIPGAATASEVMQLKSAGYRTVKFFPAELLGGVNTIRALSEPISDIQFFPTGGIRESNLQDYLDFERVACVGGTWLAPPVDIDNNHWDEIEKRCKTLARRLANPVIAGGS